MPAWWKRRPISKSKAKKSSSASDITATKQPAEESEGESIKEKANSFDGVIRISRPNGHAAVVVPNRANCESNGVFAFGHPLPRPFISSPLLSPPPLDLGTAAASCSASASSVSSSGSSDDTHEQGFYR
ncbi:hypothetical protein KSP40_PGU022320 [Platanthera guangdongensis]|uniref:Uncharacterized protein n=1 Tax=Platanthera guangdongensis TaxID=2320717 RepID=A0ABR2N538_9ASPA